MNCSRLLVISSFVLALCSCTSEKEAKLTIACAANFEAPADSILAAFEAETKIKTELIVNATGSITAQIESGAPYDVFVSANKLYPAELYSKNLTEKPEIFAVGNLIFVYPKAHKFERLDEYLLSDQVGKIAVADPEIAPFGHATIEYLKSIQLYDSLQNKIVYGESIGQVNQFFDSGAVDVMFSSNSYINYLKQDEDAIHIYSGYENVYHSAVVVLSEDKKQVKSARKFMDFLLSNESSKILEYFGYSTN